MQCVSLHIDVFINKPVSHIICIWFVTSSDAVCMRLIQLIPNRPQTNFSMQTCNACSTLCCCENGAKYAMLVSDQCRPVADRVPDHMGIKLVP